MMRVIQSGIACSIALAGVAGAAWCFVQGEPGTALCVLLGGVWAGALVHPAMP